MSLNAALNPGLEKKNGITQGALNHVVVLNHEVLKENAVWECAVTK
jgi:hypothetical protein